jgi:hypothetical protein
MTNPDTPRAGQIQGEGDYVSARKYQKEQQAFATDPAKVDKKAHEAEAALEGPEGEELERARLETAKGHPRKG